MYMTYLVRVVYVHDVLTGCSYVKDVLRVYLKDVLNVYYLCKGRNYCMLFI